MSKRTQIKKIFGIASLFEGVKYVSIYNSLTGGEIGHISAKRNGKFLAHVLSTGEKSIEPNFEQAKNFLKGFEASALLIETDTRPILKYEFYLIGDFGQARKLGEAISPREKDKELKRWKGRHPYHTVKVVEIRDTEKPNKNQVAIFE